MACMEINDIRLENRSDRSITDAQLANASLAGDSEAWDLIVTRYAELVLGVCTRATLEPERAELCTLATFNALSESLALVRNLPNMREWLMETAQRLAAKEQPNAPRLSSRDLVVLDQQHMIRTAMEQLDSRCQLLLRLQYYQPETLEYDELAVKLGVPSERLEEIHSHCLKAMCASLDRAGFGWRAQPPQEENPGPACEVPYSRLVAYSEGRLQGAQLMDMGKHLGSDCARCRYQLGQLEQLMGLMHTDPRRSPSQELLDQLEQLYRSHWDERQRQWAPLASPEPRRPLAVVGWTLLTLVVLLVFSGAIYALLELRVTPRAATLASISGGELQIQPAEDAPWLKADEGQLIPPGSHLRSSPNTIAVLQAFDGTVLRIESEGEWQLLRLDASQNRRISRIVIRQLRGQASFASATPQRLASVSMVIEVPAAGFDLVGTATWVTDDNGITTGRIHQGSCTVRTFEGERQIGPGEALTVMPAASPILVSPIE